MKVKVDGSLCTGHGRCYSLAPSVFAPDNEGYNTERDTVVVVAGGLERAATRALRACPERAISVLEE